MSDEENIEVERDDQITIGEKTYDIVEQSGREYLDPDQIVFLKNLIPLEVQSSIIDRLKELEYVTGKEVGKEKFKKVVESYVDLYKKDGKWAKGGNKPLAKTGDYHSFQAERLGVPNTSNKFLKVGEDAGLYDKRTQKAVKAPSQPKTVRAKAVEQDLKKFQIHDKVKKWQDSDKFSDAGRGVARKLWQALILLDLSPDELLEADGAKGSEAKIDWLKNRMKQETFTDVTGKKWKFGEIDSKGKKSGWVYETGKEFGSEQRYGKGAGTALYKKGKTYGSKFHHPRPKDFKKGGDSVRKEFTKYLRHFLATNEVTVGDQPIGTILSQKVAEAKHGKIHMTAEEILAMTRCIRDVKNRPYEIFDDATNETYKVDDDHWHDAEMYFIIGLSIGWRRQEALTAVCKRIPEGTVDQSGLTINDKEGTIRVWIYTRKTERVGRAYWGGFVLSSDVGVWAHKLIMDKLKRIDNKDPKLKLYSKVWDNPQTGVRESYDMHPLIGRDDQYIKIGTLHLPKDAKLSDTEKDKYRKNPYSEFTMFPQVRETKEIALIHVILRYCYKKVGLMEDYWYKDSLHAVRHTFAQMWLKKSKRDLAWVMKWGHWGGVDVLEKHYGQQTDEQFLETAHDYAEIKLDDIADKEKEKRETVKSKIEAEQTRMDVELGFGKTSKESKKDSDEDVKE